MQEHQRVTSKSDIFQSCRMSCTGNLAVSPAVAGSCVLSQCTDADVQRCPAPAAADVLHCARWALQDEQDWRQQRRQQEGCLKHEDDDWLPRRVVFNPNIK